MAHGRKTGGRQVGTPNKATASVKAALEEAFERLGGVEVLAAWAQENQTEFYRIWSRIAPRDFTVESRLTLEDIIAASNGEVR